MDAPRELTALADAAGSPGRRRRGRWRLAAILAVALLVFVRVDVIGPRVHVQWSVVLTPAARAALERRYDLRNPKLVDGATNTWRYDLRTPTRENIKALLEDPAVRDTSHIDHDALATSDGRVVTVGLWYPYRDLFPRPSELLALHRSLWMLLAGAVLLWTARSASRGRRRAVMLGTLVLVAGLAMAFPYNPSFVTMGGSADHVRSRADFEDWFGGQRVRFEKHLSQIVLLEVYRALGPSDTAPARAMLIVARGATVWFVLSALVIGALEGWSPLVLRYLGLALLAPSALLYFGWREFGYLSLSVAAFPLLERGLRDDSMRLEGGSVAAGLGAALHGAGLVSLAGAGLAAIGASGRARQRLARAARVAVWATAAYLGWMAIYVIVLKLPIHADPGPAAIVSAWRPWAVSEMRLGRLAPAILSATGMRDISMSAWVAGVPLIAVAASLWRRCSHEVRVALLYAIPSVLFLVFRWPFEGIGGGMDLVVAGFPALYALAWVCAHDERRAMVAAALLASAHYAFWRVVLDQHFQP
ncbi:MAG TPA: hypothetical protein VG871_07975 [Vicinamibacterales bacterium]|nr:hypothetical protein [Vicinamibacterales bacterium]